MIKNIILLTFLTLLVSCKNSLAPVAKDALKPFITTQPTPHDTDDPALWIHPTDPTKSLVVGTDKEIGGGIYLYDLQGKIVNSVTNLDRPNNVDVAYGILLNGKPTDIAVFTERKKNKIRVFSLPDLKPIDNGGIDVFENETDKDPMGIALYTRPTDNQIFAIVGRKFGPSGTYLWQYQLQDSGTGAVSAKVVRKFGTFSQKKEIEAIAVDNELGFVYYSDEQAGIRKYYADPAKNDNNELAFFGQKDYKSDNEGIAIYKNSDTTGYLLVSNQQANKFVVYKREGDNNNVHNHKKIAEFPVAAIECDGADATAVSLNTDFKDGMLVTMSNGMVFHYYKWSDVQKLIDTYSSN